MFNNLRNALRVLWSNPFNRRFGRGQALGRFLRWQVAQRLIATPTALPFVEGTSLLATRGMVGATANYYSGLCEPEMAFVLHLLRPGQLFVDVGANIGSYTILAAGVAGAEVLAVEPIPETFRQLRLNLQYNGVEEKVRAVNLGLSAEDGELRFSTWRLSGNRVLRADEDEPSMTVAVHRLDDVVGDNAATALKIDVEGHEKQVLAGAGSVLANPSLLAVVMETNGSGAAYGVGDEELIAMLAVHGFAPHTYDAFDRTLTPGPGPDNSVFVRHADQVEAICRGARRFKLLNGEV